jgi:hypothetical protein
VVREVDTGAVWWPAGRALLTAPRAARHPDRPGDPPEGDRRSRFGGVLAAVALVSIFSGVGAWGEDPEDIEARSRDVDAVVLASMDDDAGDVSLSYRLDGRERQGTARLAGPQREGDRLRLRVDREDPDRLWQPGIENPPGSGGTGWGDALVLVGLGLGVLAVPAVRRPRPPVARRLAATARNDGTVARDGFVVAAGRLWFGLDDRRGPLAELRAPGTVLRFEPRGLVVASGGGDELVHAWSDHAAAVGPGRPSWWLAEQGPGRVVARSDGGWTLHQPVAGRASRAAVALVDRIAAGPDLQARLAEPGGPEEVLAEALG